jgi:DNA polymerase III delta prime subunit
MNQEQLLAEVLCLPTDAIGYHMSQYLATLFPTKAIVQGCTSMFDVDEYARGGLCDFEKKASIYSQITTEWYGLHEGIQDGTHDAWMEVTWQGHRLDVITLYWTVGFNETYHFWILADREEVARDFMLAVCTWNSEIRGEVLVFDSGCWHKDEHLFHAIKDATFDNLVLRGSLKEDIRADLVQFFASRHLYEEYGIPWKRGILFVGPPGNGKTHAVKALINALGQPCLYVKSFRVEYRTDEDNIRDVFNRAREAAPCVLVLEDLDSLLTSQNRSFFLNELDGFATNVGIVTLATTNHPERLDPSILDRPSRFDRKYPFELPALAERQAYIKLWNTSLKSALCLSTEGEAQIADMTEGFSFAYLKELFLSAMMRWITTPEPAAMEVVMASQVDVLREQMVSASAVVESASDDGDGTKPIRHYITRSPYQKGKRLR